VSGVHPVAAAGFASAADVYERARPSYPHEAVAWVAERTELGPGRTVVDVGAGTGKLTRLLVATSAEREELLAGVRALTRGLAETFPFPYETQIFLIPRSSDRGENEGGTSFEG
jgi:hypothetical protein